MIAHIGDDTGCRYDQQRWRLSQCGRPLGLRFDSVGNLFVLDAYRGIKKIDIRTGFVEIVCDVKLAFERLEKAPREFIFIDDFVIDEHFGAKNSTDAKNYIFYISDASSKWPLEFVNHVVLDSDKSGRILKCDSSSGDVEIIDSGLAFPNGLEWTPNKDAILVNELNERRILKYNIREENQARGRQENQDRWRQKREISASNLPGFPDNIKRGLASQKMASQKTASQKIASSFDETYWVALYEGFDINHINPLYRVLTNFPLLVQTFTGAAHNLGLLLHKIGSKINYPPLEQLGYEIKSLIIHQKYCKSYGLILQLDAKGNILKSLHSPGGVINHLSEVFETVEDGKRILYLGSYFNNYIGRLVLD